jgi:hypothetical protein
MNGARKRAEMSGGEFYFTFSAETIREHCKNFDGLDTFS